MAKERPMDGGISEALAHNKANTKYLGSRKVVDNLVRQFAHEILVADHQDTVAFRQEVDKESRHLANILIGNDKRYSGPPWNTPGHIDEYVAKKAGVHSDDPEERVAGSLVNLIVELLELAHIINDERLVEEQWRGNQELILGKYVSMLMGMPNYGLSSENV